MITGKSVFNSDLPPTDDSIHPLTGDQDLPDSSRKAHQTFRLTQSEKRRLYELANDQGVSVSTLLRSFIRGAE